MNKEKIVFVTTDADLWNSADEAHFFVKKGMVKPLPEVTTPIIEDALAQGLLRESTEEELNKYKYDLDIEKAIQEHKIKTGKTYEDTIKNYHNFKNIEDKKEKEKKISIEKPDESKLKLKPEEKEDKVSKEEGQKKVE